MRRRQFSNRLGIAPVGIVGDDMFAPGPSMQPPNEIHQSPETINNNNNTHNTNTTSTEDDNFRILPTSSDDEILNQIQALMTLTLQNQAAINKIVTVLEKQGVSIASPQENHIVENESSSSKGKGRLTTIDTNPFD